MPQTSVQGPAWVGIGAQRSGTTWFVDLLTQHPMVTLGRSEKKELHVLESSLILPIESINAKLRVEFADLDTVAGEFTPAYLRCPWVPETAAKVLPPDVIFFVLLRNPIERFTSAISHEMTLAGWEELPDTPSSQVAAWSKFRGVDSVWAGMYATHLRTWMMCFPRERFFVAQYEQMVADPVRVMNSAHAALGLDPVALVDVTAPSSTTTPEDRRWKLAGIPWLEDALIEIYRPEVTCLIEEWDIEPRLWPQFSL